MIPVTLKELPPSTVNALFEQSLIGYYKGEPYLHVMCRFASLLREEYQRQVFDVTARRQSDTRKREKA